MEAIKKLLDAAQSNRKEDGTYDGEPEFDNMLAANYVNELNEEGYQSLVDTLVTVIEEHSEGVDSVRCLIANSIAKDEILPKGTYAISARKMVIYLMDMVQGEIDELAIDLYVVWSGANMTMRKILKAGKNIPLSPPSKGEDGAYMAGTPAPGEHIDACGADGPWKFMGTEECREIFGEGWEG